MYLKIGVCCTFSGSWVSETCDGFIFVVEIIVLSRISPTLNYDPTVIAALLCFLHHFMFQESESVCQVRWS